jgi:hypothetical protein
MSRCLTDMITVTQHTIAFCSVQFIDITLTKVLFHKYYIPRGSTTETLWMQYYTLFKLEVYKDFKVLLGTLRIFTRLES